MAHRSRQLLNHDACLNMSTLPNRMPACGVSVQEVGNVLCEQEALTESTRNDVEGFVHACKELDTDLSKTWDA